MCNFCNKAFNFIYVSNQGLMYLINEGSCLLFSQILYPLCKKIKKDLNSFLSWNRTSHFFSILSNVIVGMYHRGFLEHWNSQKKCYNIWQRFSYLLDEWIEKICKKNFFHDGFLSYLQNSTANSAHLAAHFLPCFSLPCHHENSISSIFLESPDQVDMKNVVKCWKDFLSYFTTLETYCDGLYHQYFLMIF